MLSSSCVSISFNFPFFYVSISPPPPLLHTPFHHLSITFFTPSPFLPFLFITPGGRRPADEEEQRDVISALISWHEERGGVERPHDGPHRALLCRGPHRGQVGLVERGAVRLSVAACFSGDEKQTRGIWDFGSEMPYPLGGREGVVLVLIQSHLCKKIQR